MSNGTNSAGHSGLLEETSRLLFIGLAGWVLGGVGAFVALSGSGLVGDLRSDGLRAVALTLGFGLGALALLAYGTLRIVQGAGAAAVFAAVAFFLVPPAVQLFGTAASLGPGLLGLLALHAGAATALAARTGRHLDRVLVPETALLLLAVGLVVADLTPAVLR